MESKKTVWSLFRDCVNSKSIGEVITRQDIIVHIDSELNNNVGINELYYRGSKNFSEATLDSACNMAEKVGYLDKTNKSGIYRVVKHFAADYTVSQLRKDYDNGIRCKSNED